MTAEEIMQEMLENAEDNVECNPLPPTAPEMGMEYPAVREYREYMKSRGEYIRRR